MVKPKDTQGYHGNSSVWSFVFFFAVVLSLTLADWVSNNRVQRSYLIQNKVKGDYPKVVKILWGPCSHVRPHLANSTSMGI